MRGRQKLNCLLVIVLCLAIIAVLVIEMVVPNGIAGLFQQAGGSAK